MMTVASESTLVRSRSAFTLVELLITVAIIGIMAASVMVAMWGATESAKRKKTEAMVARIDAIIKTKWDSYLSRRVPVVIPEDETFTDQNNNARWDSGEPFQDANGNNMGDQYPGARIRLDALRDLMRMELPDRWSDVSDNPTVFNYSTNTGGGIYTTSLARPAVNQALLRRYNANMTRPGAPSIQQAQDYQGAELLFLIVEAASQEEDTDATRLLGPDTTGDKDGDGFKEIHDAWGNPIRFLRWAPGFDSPLQALAGGRTVNSSTPDSRTYTFDANISYGSTPVPAGEVISPSLSQVSGAYVGCAVIGRSPGDNKLDFAMAARITGYEVIPGTPIVARFTCKTPVTTTMSPGMVAVPYNFTIYPADPFDAAGVYPSYPVGNSFPPGVPNTAQPTFDLRPLVYSPGPDASYGVLSDSTPTALRYSQNGCNPFNFLGGQPIGYQASIPGERGDSKDNIHNHALGVR